MPDERIIFVDGVGDVAFPASMGDGEILERVEKLPPYRAAKYKKEIEKARKGAEKAEGWIKGLDQAEYSLNPANIGDGFNYLGQIARGFSVDVMSGRLNPDTLLRSGMPTLTATGQAIRQEPIDDSRLNLLQKGLSDIPEAGPEVAVMLATGPQGAAVQAGATGLMTFFRSLSRNKDREDISTSDKVSRVVTDTMFASMAPALGRLGVEKTGKAIKKLLNPAGTGKVSQLARNQNFQRVAESVSSNLLFQQPLEMLASSPDFLDAPPEQRWEMIVRSLIGNVAWIVPEFLSKGATGTMEAMKEYGVKDQAALVMDQFLSKVDPAFEDVPLFEKKEMLPEPKREGVKTEFFASDQPGGLSLGLVRMVQNAVKSDEFKATLYEKVTGQKAPESFASKSDFLQGKRQETGQPQEISGFNKSKQVLDSIRPLEFPELMSILNELGTPGKAVNKIAGDDGVRGMFSYGDSTLLQIRKDLFEKPDLAVRVFAHELGHANDYWPVKNISKTSPNKGERLISRIAGLRDEVRNLLPLAPGKGDLTPMPKGMETGIKQSISSRYPHWSPEQRGAEYLRQVEAYYMKQGAASESIVYDQLWQLSKRWRPMPQNITPEHLAYRLSGQEVYADFVSAILVDPKKVKDQAPMAFDMFLNWMDSKPKFRDAYLEIQDTLGRGNISRRRVAHLKADQKRGTQRLIDVRKLREKFKSSHWERFKQNYSDEIDYIISRVKEIEADKDKRVRVNPVNKFDEARYGDAAIVRFMRDAGDQVLKPVKDAGGTSEDLGVYFTLSRIAGDPDSYARVQDLKGNVTPEQRAALDSLVKKYRQLKIKQSNGQNVQKRIDKILSELENLGLTEDDINIWAFDIPGQGTRAELANTYGFNPVTAKETLGAWLSSLDPKLQKALNESGKHFRDYVYKIVQQAYNAGVVSEKAFMEAVVPNKEWYATFRDLDHINNEYITPGVKRATGSIQAIENPFHSTMFKMVPLIRAIQKQRAYRASRDFFMEHYPDEFVRKSRKQKFPPPGFKTVEIFEDGTPHKYYVSEGIKTAFDSLEYSDIQFGAGFLSQFHNRIVKKFVINWKLAFVAGNIIKDMRRSLFNLPAVVGAGKADGGGWSFKHAKGIRRRYIKEYFNAFKAATDYVAGRKNADIEEMLAHYAISSPFSGLYASRGDSSITRAILGEAGADLPTSKIDALDRFVSKTPILSHIETLGAITEVMPKIAAWRTMKDRMPTFKEKQELAKIVRDYVGTPNYRKRGKNSQFLNAVFPFSNIAIQGFKSDLSVAASKGSRAGWWLTWAAVDGPFILMAAAMAAGLMGEESEEWMDHVGTWDMTAYNLVPLPVNFYGHGSVTGKKAGMLRLPRDEMSRMVSGPIVGGIVEHIRKWKSESKGQPYELKRLAKAFTYITSQLPGENNLITIADAFGKWMSDKQMTDPFTGANVFDDANLMLGKEYTYKDFFSYIVDKVGAGSFLPMFGHNADQKEFVELIPGIDRFIKFSDAGMRERQGMQEKLQRSYSALVRVGFNPKLQKYRQQFYRLVSLGKDDRSANQQMEYVVLSSFISPIERLVGEVQDELDLNPDRIKDPVFKKRIKVTQDIANGLVEDIEWMMNMVQGK